MGTRAEIPCHHMIAHVTCDDRVADVYHMSPYGTPYRLVYIKYTVPGRLVYMLEPKVRFFFIIAKYKG